MEKVPLKRVFLIKHTSNILVHDVINLLYIYIYICIYIIYNIYIYIGQNLLTIKQKVKWMVKFVKT